MRDPNIDFGYDEQHQCRRSRESVDAAFVCVQAMLIAIIAGIVYFAVAWAVS